MRRVTRKRPGLCLSTILSFGWILPGGLSAVAGEIAGRVLGDDGKHIPGARLQCKKLPEYRRSTDGGMAVADIGFSRTVTPSQDGSFFLADLPPGKYHLCAAGSNSNQVSGCVWDPVPVIQLAAGQRLSQITRTVHDSVGVTIRVRDPNRRIEAPDSLGRVTKERRLFIGVYCGKIYGNAALVASTPTETTYRVAIPRQRSARLFIDTELPVRDLAGNAVELRRQTNLEIRSVGTAPLSVELNVP